MAARLSQPISQLRHSNVAVVRVAKKGKRLEIACYKNKVLSWRNGSETRLDEVLQVDRVFLNVSRGEYASMADIHDVLGKQVTCERDALIHILDHGEMQVAQQERSAEMDALQRDACTFVAQKCVNPHTQMPYQLSVIEQASKDIGFSWRLDDSAKKQALVLIHELVTRQTMPIMRAKMRLCFRVPAALYQPLPSSSSPPSSSGDGTSPAVATVGGPSHLRAPIARGDAVGLPLVVDVEVANAALDGSGDGVVVGVITPDRYREVDAWARSHGVAITVVNDALTAASESADAMLLDTGAAVQRAAAAVPAAEIPSTDGAASTTDAIAAKKDKRKAEKAALRKLEVEKELAEKSKKKHQEDEEEDLVSERKLKKQAKKHHQEERGRSDDDDDGFDYGDDEAHPED